VRRECPTVWALTLGECRAGIRRWAGTDLAESYQRIIAYRGEGDSSPPDPWARPLGDLVDPARSGSATTLINLASQELGNDVADWRLPRIRNLVAQAVQRRTFSASEGLQ
jgi:hypothetical protein